MPVSLGAGAIIYSLMTDYELGATKGISMRTHLTLDLVSGIFAGYLPMDIWVCRDYVDMPHLILGILEIGASLMTKTQPQYGPGHKDSHGRLSTH